MSACCTARLAEHTVGCVETVIQESWEALTHSKVFLHALGSSQLANSRSRRAKEGRKWVELVPLPLVG